MRKLATQHGASEERWLGEQAQAGGKNTAWVKNLLLPSREDNRCEASTATVGNMPDSNRSWERRPRALDMEAPVQGEGEQEEEEDEGGEWAA